MSVYRGRGTGTGTGSTSADYHETELRLKTMPNALDNAITKQEFFQLVTDARKRRRNLGLINSISNDGIDDIPAVQDIIRPVGTRRQETRRLAYPIPQNRVEITQPFVNSQMFLLSIHIIGYPSSDPPDILTRIEIRHYMDMVSSTVQQTNQPRFNSGSPQMDMESEGDIATSPSGQTIVSFPGYLESINETAQTVGVFWNPPRPRNPVVIFAGIDAFPSIGFRLETFGTNYGSYDFAPQQFDAIFATDLADMCRRNIRRRLSNRNGYFHVLGNVTNELGLASSNTLTQIIRSPNLQVRRVKNKKRLHLGFINSMSNDGAGDLPITTFENVNYARKESLIFSQTPHQTPLSANVPPAVRPVWRTEKLFLNKIDWEEENIWQGGEFNFLIPLYAGGPNNYLIALDEILPLVEVIVKFPQIVRDEVIALVDTVAKQAQKTFTEAVTLVDTIIRQLIFVKELLEAIVLVDTITKLTTAVRTETIVLVDTIAKLTSTVKTEAVILVDSIAKLTRRTLSEVATLVDSIRFGYFRTFTEQIPLVDTIIKSTAKVLTDPLILVDTIRKATTAVRIETVVLADTIAKLTSRILTDALTLVDLAVEAIITTVISIGNFIIHSVYELPKTIKGYATSFIVYLTKRDHVQKETSRSETIATKGRSYTMKNN